MSTLSPLSGYQRTKSGHRATDVVDRCCRKRIFGFRAKKSVSKTDRIENIDLSIPDFGFYYCSVSGISRSMTDFFDSIDPELTLARLALNAASLVEAKAAA